MIWHAGRRSKPKIPQRLLQCTNSGFSGAEIQIRFIASLKPPFKFSPDIRHGSAGGLRLQLRARNDGRLRTGETKGYGSF
jgi:hypothetical protein